MTLLKSARITRSYFSLASLFLSLFIYQNGAFVGFSVELPRHIFKVQLPGKNFSTDLFPADPKFDLPQTSEMHVSQLIRCFFNSVLSAQTLASDSRANH